MSTTISHTPTLPPIDESQMMCVRLGVIGRSRAGKSVKFLMLFRELLRLRLSSGYYFGLRSPLETNERMQALEKILHQLRTPPGAITTVDPTEFDFFLFRGNRALVRFAFREVVGQVLTNTTRRSDINRLSQYEDYVTDLAKCDVLWSDVPCHGGRMTAEQKIQFDYDRNSICDYLRIASCYRADSRPMSVLIVPTKLDARFETETQARKLNQVSLKNTFHQAADFIEGCDIVRSASIVPVSALGFQTTKLVQHEGQSAHVLRSNAQPAPFNLVPLLLLSLIYGMAHQPLAPNLNAEELAHLIKTLSRDFKRLDGWHCHVKG